MQPPVEYPEAHLLIVDDDESSILLLRRILEPHYHVTVSSDGLEALRLLTTQPFDLIVCDIHMPGFDGFQVLESVRAMPGYADIPVVLISGAADSADIARGLEMSANDYISKPFDRQVALARIRTQIALKHSLDAQKQMIRELQSAQAMRDRFFHIASHDLKNPMNNIRMAHFLLRGMLEDDPSADVLLENIEIALDAMQGIVGDFLDLAAIQSQALDLKLSDVPVEDALWDVIIQFNISAQKKNIVLKLDDVAGHVRADSRRLIQALGNLVSNAIKYSPRDTVVRFTTEQKEGVIRILIHDEGPGIPQDERELLFREFGKLSTTPTEGEGRTGLGLWIVKQLVTLQNGLVGADFPESGGSVFWVELPAAVPAAEKRVLAS